jgi:elongation factor 1-beta
VRPLRPATRPDPSRPAPRPPPSFTPSATDASLFDALKTAPDAAKFPNVARFYKHLAALGADKRAALPKGAAAAAGAAAPAKAAAADEDDAEDLFGDDDEAAEKAAKKAAAPPAKPAAEAKKPKEKPIARSICVYEVKPMSAATKPEDMEKALRTIQQDGLKWSETFEVIEMGFGIKKLRVQMVIEDEKVDLTDLEEKMVAFKGTELDEDGEIEDLIQSVDQLSMNVRRRRRRRGARASAARRRRLTPLPPPVPLFSSSAEVRVKSVRQQCENPLRSLAPRTPLEREVRGLRLDLHRREALDRRPDRGNVQRRRGGRARGRGAAARTLLLAVHGAQLGDLGRKLEGVAGRAARARVCRALHAHARDVGVSHAEALAHGRDELRLVVPDGARLGVVAPLAAVCALVEPDTLLRRRDERDGEANAIRAANAADAMNVVLGLIG